MEGYGDVIPSETMTTTPIWQNRTLQWLVAVVCVVAASWYAPTLRAVGWRVFHPSGRLEYRGLHVQVPWPWVTDFDWPEAEATETPLGISLRKMPATQRRRVPPQSLFVTVMSPDPGVSAEQQTERWLQSFRDVHAGAVFSTVTPVPTPAGASCESAKGDPKRPLIVWTCISLQGGWVADFEGYDSDVPVFFRLIATLK